MDVDKAIEFLLQNNSSKTKDLESENGFCNGYREALIDLVELTDVGQESKYIKFHVDSRKKNQRRD